MNAAKGRESNSDDAHRGRRARLDGAFVIALSRSYGYAHRESRKLVADHGLTFTQFEVLEALMHKGPLTVSALIQAVLSTGGNITVVVRNLEKRKLIERTVNPDDGRSFIVRLTGSGRALMQKLYPLHSALLSAALAPLSDEEIKTVIGLLRKLKGTGATDEETYDD